MKKVLWVVVLAALMLMACSGGSSPQPAPEENEPAAEVEEVAEVEEEVAEAPAEEPAEDEEHAEEEMAEEEMTEEAAAEETEEAEEAVEEEALEEEATEEEMAEEEMTEEAAAEETEEETEEETVAESEEEEEMTEGEVAEDETADEEMVEGEVAEDEMAEEAATEAEATDIDPATVAGVILANEELSAFAEALDAAGILNVLADPTLGPVTVFAPSNAAFADLDPAVVDGLMANPQFLTLILRFHILPEVVLAADVAANASLMTDLGGGLTVAAVDDTIILGDRGAVVEADIEASNGVIHVVDQVLSPTQAMVEVAIQRLIAEEQALGNPEVDLVSIADVINGSTDFTMLAILLEEAGLTEVLADEEGLFTLFAPTDQAFEAAAEALASLGEDPEALANALAYHVVAEIVSSVDIVSSDQLTALQGSPITISAVEDGVVMLNESVGFILVDVETSNGVIHVIDTVMLPPATEDEDATADE